MRKKAKRAEAGKTQESTSYKAEGFGDKKRSVCSSFIVPSLWIDHEFAFGYIQSSVQ